MRSELFVEPPFRPAAVVFDLDGLLFDTERVWVQSIRDVVEQRGGKWIPGLEQALVGKANADAVKLVAENCSWDYVDDLGFAFLKSALNRYGDGVPLRLGAEELVRSLFGRVPLAIASNSRRVLADVTLKGSGLSNCFDTVVVVDDVEHPKPSPDLYVLACKRLQVDPRQAVALEDSEVGVQAARRAGLWVIACPSLRDSNLVDADIVVASLLDVSADVLLGG